jgi:hypothetical protein
VIKQFSKYCTDKISAEQSFISEGLLEGSVKTFEAYRHTTGVLQGLEIAKGIIFDTVEDYEEEAEDI